MVKYTLDIQDHPNPDSRLRFITRLELFLGTQKDAKVIEGYSLSTPNSVTCIFKTEAEG